MLDLPLEYALIGFDHPDFSGKILPELVALAQRGIVRYVDIVFLDKEEDGTTYALELNDVDEELYELFVPIGEHLSSLLTEEDLKRAADKIPAGTAALLLLWENLWTADLRRAIGDSGGVLLDRASIQPEVVEEYLASLAAEGAAEGAETSPE